MVILLHIGHSAALAIFSVFSLYFALRNIIFQNTNKQKTTGWIIWVSILTQLVQYNHVWVLLVEEFRWLLYTFLASIIISVLFYYISTILLLYVGTVLTVWQFWCFLKISYRTCNKKWKRFHFVF